MQSSSSNGKPFSDLTAREAREILEKIPELERTISRLRIKAWRALRLEKVPSSEGTKSR